MTTTTHDGDLKDREGHGEEFKGHMRRINKATNLNITVLTSLTFNNNDNNNEDGDGCSGRDNNNVSKDNKFKVLNDTKLFVRLAYIIT